MSIDIYKPHEKIDITNYESTIEGLQKKLDYHKHCYETYSNLLSSVKSSGIKQGDFAIHRAAGKCIVKKLWVNISENKVKCYVNFADSKEKSRHVLLEELVPYNDMSRILYER